jgi:DNA-binding NarL/FixJ family response regulator
MTGEQPITIVVVEDDAMVRGWVKLSLAGSEFSVAGEAGTAAGAIELTQRRRPQILLLDYRLPDKLGTEVTRVLRRAGLEMPILLMTANAEPGFNEMVREAGANGSALKTGEPDELLGALRRAVRGEFVVDGRHPRRSPGQAALSPREREVLRLVAAGATNSQAASALGVGSETVKTLLNRAYAKLGVRRRAEAVAAATSHGLL